MDKGDRFVVEIQYDGQSGNNYNADVSRFILVGSNERANFWNSQVKAAVQAYAAKQTPAPTPAGWTPKRGERVLVECKGTVIDVNPSIMPVSALIEFKHGNAEWFLTTHILPDPVKPKFSAGDEVFSTHVFRAAAVVRYELRSNPGYWVNNGLAASSEWWSEDSLISLAEAREKLAK